ncbi:oxygen-dependent protoporphyrinogen oxidase [Microbacteriaceae bacterium SG_E_30_P1]|uniref:Oxygen-dependent protoporphyrinogen oxidase n=1 Tax=Antiquaquibacter oligotrophicus TaxID=2880260 RepID=A0ABT6KRZ1_9MICO|nr:FAD-dependent oxidoreductase [Antiquaquibacter oligotrophicus]MDH6182258.1 oxygen-dependent protoporphyrinogen oxidase [Antiquaquibacter oligotrophicus]
MTDVTVVGGGIGGLVVARLLALAGRTVTLLEASDRLGGTVASHTVGGLQLDAGAESFATRGGTVRTLAAELGLGDRVVAPAALSAWLQPVSGEAVPLPDAALLGIPGTPLAADVITAVGGAAAFRAQLDSLIPALWARKSLTVGQLVRRRMGAGVLERLVAPVVHGVYSIHPDDLPIDRVAGLRQAYGLQGSLAAAVRSLRDAAPAGSAVEGIEGGVHRLVSALASDLDRLGVAVELGHEVTSLAGLSGTVIVAAPGVVAPVDGRDVTVATLVVDAPWLDAAPRGTGVLVARGARGIRARALTHSTAKWPWLRDRAEGKHVLRLSYDDEPDNLAESARTDAEALLAAELPPASILDFARVTWTRPAALTTPTDHIVVGETVGGSGIAGIVAHAERTARTLLENS